MNRAAAALLTALLAAGCGSSEQPQGFEIDQQTLERIEGALEHLKANAPELVVWEILETCGKWRHIDKPCVDEEVRVAQLDCWLEAGKPTAERMRMAKRRQRVTNIAIMRDQNLCMARQRWRKVKPGQDI